MAQIRKLFYTRPIYVPKPTYNAQPPSVDKVLRKAKAMKTETQKNGSSIARAEALIIRLRSQFHGEQVSELEMLLRARENIDSPSTHILIALAIFWFSIEGVDTVWKRWGIAALAIATVCDIIRIKLQKREFDAAISIFIKSAPRSLREALPNENRPQP